MRALGEKLPRFGANLLSDRGHRAASCINTISALQTPPKLSAQRVMFPMRALLCSCLHTSSRPPSSQHVSSQSCEVPPTLFALLLGTSGAPVQQKDLIACQN